MDAISAMIQIMPSSRRIILKRCVPHVNFCLILLVGSIFLLLPSGIDIKNVLPPVAVIRGSQHTSRWLSYDGAPPNVRSIPRHSGVYKPQWKTIVTFKSMGSKKTYPFPVSQNWRILWSCGHTEQDYYSLTIEVDRPDGSVVDPAAAITQCMQTITRSTVQEHKGGMVYLNIDSDSGWTVQVQVFTSAPVKILPLSWKTQRTFSGNGNGKTLSFTVPRHWQMRWRCTLVKKDDIDVLFADLDKINNAVADSGAINAICKNGNTTDWTQQYIAGTYTLNVFSNTFWTIQVQTPQ